MWLHLRCGMKDSVHARRALHAASEAEWHELEVLQWPEFASCTCPSQCQHSTLSAEVAIAVSEHKLLTSRRKS